VADAHHRSAAEAVWNVSRSEQGVESTCHFGCSAARADRYCERVARSAVEWFGVVIRILLGGGIGVFGIYTLCHLDAVTSFFHHQGAQMFGKAVANLAYRKSGFILTGVGAVVIGLTFLITGIVTLVRWSTGV